MKKIDKITRTLLIILATLTLISFIIPFVSAFGYGNTEDFGYNSLTSSIVSGIITINGTAGINGTNGIDGINGTFTDILNATQFKNVSTTWSINLTWLYSWATDLFYTKTDINSNNASWSSTYNATYDSTSADVLANRSNFLSTYNSTYNTWAYNQTYSGSTYNATYDAKNTSQWIVSGSDIYNRNLGNVGIGTTNPLRALSVGSASGSNEISMLASTTGFNSILFGDGTTGSDVYRGYVQYQHNGDYMLFGTAATEQVRILSNGNVGIGTASPGNKLSVVSGNIGISNGYGIVSNEYPNYLLLSDVTNAATDKTIIRAVNDIAGNGVEIQQYNGTAIASFKQGGNVGIGTTNPGYILDVTAASVEGMRIQSPGRAVVRLYPTTTGGQSNSRNWAIAADKNVYGDFVISQSTTAGGDPQTGTDVLSILNSGNVGIGTTNPSTLLTVNKYTTDRTGIVDALELYRNTASAPYGGGIRLLFTGESYNNVKKNWSAIDTIMDTADTGVFSAGLSFKVLPSINASLTEAMRIKDNGYVGIGTTNPTQALSVVGNVNITGSTMSGGGSAGKVMCWKADGVTLGYCSSVVDITGGCTCN